MRIMTRSEPVASGSTDTELVRDADRRFLVLTLASAILLIVALAAFIALVGALILAASPARASSQFGCRGVPFVSDAAKAAFKEHAPNNAARQLMIEYALRWDAADMRRLCEAKVRGENVTLGCPDGRRDWEAIVTSVPDGQLDLPQSRLNERLAALRAERAAMPPHQSALNHCIRIGAIDGLIQGEGH